jgi:hypothetical protein
MKPNLDAAQDRHWLYWRLPNGRTGRLGPLPNDPEQAPPRNGLPSQVVFWRVRVRR